MLTEQLSLPGEHDGWLEGRIGALEAKWMVPEIVKPGYVAILGHPHSLHGGTMNNKVVTTLARTFKESGIPSIRFNFRGVGQSLGQYDEGIGESDDMLCIAKRCLQEQPDMKIIFAGFSFGSYVSFRASQHCRHSLLISVAPPVNHFDFDLTTYLPKSWVILQGEQDDIVPSDEVEAFVRQAAIDITLIRFAEASHFFHGKLLDLRARLLDVLHERITP